MFRFGIRILVHAAVVAAVLGGVSFATDLSIRYSPDSLVDTNPGVEYVEPAITADWPSSNTLVAAAESGTFSSDPQAFVSHDGGNDWHVAPLLLGDGSMLGDVQLATHPDGTIYFATLGSQGGKEGIHVFASANHGNWFNHVAFVRNSRGHGFDHEQLAVDSSHGPYRGRMYMTVLYAVRLQPQLNACGLLWSSDRGHYFHGPVQVIDGWCFNSRPVSLSDGTVIFPFIMGSKPGASGVPPETRSDDVEIAVSKNGGESFTAPRAIGTYVWPGLAGYKRRIAEGRTNFDGDPIPQFAEGISPVTRRDVVYGIWSDMRTGNSRLLFTRSTDKGSHWSEPIAILTTGHKDDSQYQVSLAVNGLGVLGIAYLQYVSKTGSVTEMFADSADAGMTFSSPVPVQSLSAGMGFPANSGYSASSYRIPTSSFEGRLMVGLTDPGHRFPSGGDYVGMAVDHSGTFHPIWADARTGVNQIWTASATVGGPSDVPSGLTPADVTSSVDLEFGASTWDKGRHLLSIQVRLHNIGRHPLYPPFTVTVLELGNPLVPESWNPLPPPSLVNADNQQRGVGASFIYGPQMFGNLDVLAPGANSAPRTWKIAANGNSPAIVVGVNGYVSH